MPKPTPEGKCEMCGTLVPKRKRYCSPCAEKARLEREEQVRRQAANIRTWFDPRGQLREAPISRIFMRKNVVFKADGPRLTAQDQAGELLDLLIGICFAAPEYLRRTDACRYISLLHEFKCFQYSDLFSSRETSVSNTPIQRLPVALEQWIFSYFKEGRQSLMPSYALDTARFIEAHTFGFCDYEPGVWSIAPLVDMQARDWLPVSLKRRFTHNMGSPIVAARVPADCWITCKGQEAIPGGTDLLLQLTRCHLSSSFDNFPRLDCEQRGPIAFNLAAEFQFYAYLYVLGEGATQYTCPEPQDIKPVVLPRDWPIQQELGSIPMDLPAQWITHVLEFFPSSSQKEPVLHPVPNWKADIESSSESSNRLNLSGIHSALANGVVQ